MASSGSQREEDHSLREKLGELSAWVDRVVFTPDAGVLSHRISALGQKWTFERVQSSLLYKADIDEPLTKSVLCQKWSHALRNELNVPDRCEAAFCDVKNTYNK